jgi:hypothetical protein
VDWHGESQQDVCTTILLHEQPRTGKKRRLEHESPDHDADGEDDQREQAELGSLGLHGASLHPARKWRGLATAYLSG